MEKGVGEGVVHWRVGDPRGCKLGDPNRACLPFGLCYPWAPGGPTGVLRAYGLQFLAPLGT